MKQNINRPSSHAKPDANDIKQSNQIKPVHGEKIVGLCFVSNEINCTNKDGGMSILPECIAV